MSARKSATFPLPFAKKPARVNMEAECACGHLAKEHWHGGPEESPYFKECFAEIAGVVRCKCRLFNEPAQCRPADPESVMRPVAFLVPPRMFIELMRLRLRHGDRPIGAVPEGAELN